MDTVELARELQQVAEVVASLSAGAHTAPTKLIIEGLDAAIDRLTQIRQQLAPQKEWRDADATLLRPIFGDRQ